jgi:hypothetical protein
MVAALKANPLAWQLTCCAQGAHAESDCLLAHYLVWDLKVRGNLVADEVPILSAGRKSMPLLELASTYGSPIEVE